MFCASCTVYYCSSKDVCTAGGLVVIRSIVVTKPLQSDKKVDTSDNNSPTKMASGHNRNGSTSSRNSSGCNAQDSVFRLHTLAPQLFTELTVSNLTRHLELDDDKLQIFLTGEGKSIHRKTPLPWKRHSNKEKGPIEFPSNVVNAVSKLVLSLSNTQDLQSEGLFRKCGNVTRQKDLFHQIEADCSIDLSPFSTHDRATVVKQLVANFCEPLLLTRHLEAFRQAINLKNSKSEITKQKCLKVMQLLMWHLPKNNVIILKRLLPLLHDVAEEPANLMDAESLAKLFAPHFLCPKNAVGDQIFFDGTLSIATEVVAFMIHQGNRIFDVPEDFLAEVNRALRVVEEERELESGSSSSDTASICSMENVLSPMPAVFRPSRESVEDTTKAELAKLSAHIQTLPESQRRRLNKQLEGAKALANGSASPAATPKSRKHARSRSIGSSIKKRFPLFGGSSKKRQLRSSEEDDTVFSTVVPIHFENSPAPVATAVVTPAKQRTPRLRRFSEGDATPPKTKCCGQETPVANSTETDITNNNCEVVICSPLPVSEKEVSILEDQENAVCQYRQRILSSYNPCPSPCVGSDKGIGEAPVKHHHSRSRERRPRHNARSSPFNRETAL